MAGVFLVLFAVSSGVVRSQVNVAVDDSWRDEVAQATCSALQVGPGWMFAVRRECGTSRTCSQICSCLAGQDSQVKSMSCVDSLHVYAGTHPLERGMTSADVEVLGTKVYRYFTCARGDCGPNFCCCKGA